MFLCACVFGQARAMIAMLCHCLGGHGASLAQNAHTHKEHGKSMARAWQEFMANMWHAHGDSMARAWRQHGKNMARAWQGHGKSP